MKYEYFPTSPVEGLTILHIQFLICIISTERQRKKGTTDHRFCIWLQANKKMQQHFFPHYGIAKIDFPYS